MPINDRVWVREDGHVMAIHSQDQNIPTDAYGECTILVVPNGTIQPITKVEADGHMTVVPTVLPTGWRDAYVAPVPAQVSKMGLRRALREADKLKAFDDAVAKASEDAQDDYATGVVFSTTDVAILEIMKAAKINDAKRDDIFRRAEALVA